MQNNVPAGSGLEQNDLVASPENSLSYDTPQNAVTIERSPQSFNDQSEYAGRQQRDRLKARLRTAVFALLALLVIGGSTFVFLRRGDQGSRVQIGAFGDVQIPLADILDPERSPNNTQSLKVNGQLDVSNSIVLAPSVQPENPATGQLYFDQTTNRLTYYDGQQFLELQAATVGTTQITNNSVTNIFGGDTIGAGGIDLNGTAGSLAMFTDSNTLGNSLISQTGTTINIATPGNVNINGGTTTTIQGGTGGVSMSTDASTGATGSISIRTGGSSTTASGNITIDAGEGIVDGEVVEDKTFEGGLDSMVPWFGSTIAQSSAQAHTGVYSLAATATDPFWGVIELLPGTSVVAGHQYLFSLWVRADTAPRTINVFVVWGGSGGQALTLAPAIDNNTGWTEMSGVAAAPATATSAYFRVSSSGATIGEIHYLDDITMTDLSSSAAISAISIGAENAKIVTIGNLNQIGATSIYGSSGINLNSGAAGVTMQGGVMTITGNAASSLSTTNGALTLTSADSATWGVGKAVAGVGGNLTLTAGNGGDDSNNNGGDLILQGGSPHGTGIGGSVLVRPQKDSADAFQVQNSIGTPLFTADSTGMRITIGGTDASYATLTLTDAHIKSTQTTPPTASAPASCGTAPIAALTAGSTDTAGSFTITTGTGGTASTCDTTVTFHQIYGAAPKSIMVTGKTDAASVARQVYVSAVTATTFTVSFATSAGGADSTPYSFSYWVIE
jgi:hypothetical protein